MLRPKPGSRTQLEYLFPGQHMKGVPNSQSTPPQFNRRRASVARPIGLAPTFHHAEMGFEGHSACLLFGKSKSRKFRLFKFSLTKNRPLVQARASLIQVARGPNFVNHRSWPC